MLNRWLFDEGGSQIWLSGWTELQYISCGTSHNDSTWLLTHIVSCRTSKSCPLAELGTLPCLLPVCCSFQPPSCCVPNVWRRHFCHGPRYSGHCSQAWKQKTAVSWSSLLSAVVQVHDFMPQSCQRSISSSWVTFWQDSAWHVQCPSIDYTQYTPSGWGWGSHRGITHSWVCLNLLFASLD